MATPVRYASFHNGSATYSTLTITSSTVNLSLYFTRKNILILGNFVHINLLKNDYVSLLSCVCVCVVS